MPSSGFTRVCPPPQQQTLVSSQFANFNKISGQVEELAKDAELVFLNNTGNSGWVDALVEVTGRRWVVKSLKESNSTWMNKSFILPQIKLSLKESLLYLIFTLSVSQRLSYSGACYGCSVMSLCNPMDCNLPGSPVHGILQARILEWVAIPFSRGSSWPMDQTCISCIGRWVLYHLNHWGSPFPP